jgi:transcriptional regulator with XRE-family HTH domain
MKIEAFYSGYKLKKILFEKQMKQSELLKIMENKTEKKWSKQHLSKWVAGDFVPEKNTQILLCSIFNISESYFDFNLMNANEENEFQYYLSNKLDEMRAKIESNYKKQLKEWETLARYARK